MYDVIDAGHTLLFVLSRVLNVFLCCANPEWCIWAGWTDQLTCYCYFDLTTAETDGLKAGSDTQQGKEVFIIVFQT